MFGGVLGELLLWFQIRHKLHEGLPQWSKSVLYWVVTAAMVLAGGLLVVAINIGISAPLLLKNLSSQLPTIEPGRTD